MTHALVTVSRGIIDQVTFYDSAALAIRALADFVKGMNAQDDNAAIFSSEGLVANAKDFLDENEQFILNEDLLNEVEASDNTHP